MEVINHFICPTWHYSTCSYTRVRNRTDSARSALTADQE